MLDNVDPKRLEEEKPALFHILKTRKRQEVRMIRSLKDEYGNNQTTTNGIMRAFTTFLRRKYEPIVVQDECIERMAEIEWRDLPTAWREQLEQPITPEDEHIVVKKGGKKKAPGSDRFGWEYYKANWATIKDGMDELMMNQMFIERKVSPQQKHGVIVCLPKICEPTTLADFRPITVLNTDYRMMARITVNRVRTTMAELLQQRELCGVPGRTIFKAVATVREAIT